MNIFVYYYAKKINVLMIKSFVLFFFLLLLGGCASDRQLSDDICFSHKSALHEIKLKIGKDGNFSIKGSLRSGNPLQVGALYGYIGKSQLLENDEIILISDTDMTISIFRKLANTRDLQKIDSVTLRLNILADSLQVTDGIWLYRTTCELKGVKMRRGTIDSSGVFRRDK
jgi:hypothetical protein